MMMLRRKVRISWKDLIRSFRDADVDNSGTLDPSELNRVLRRFSIDLTNGQFKSLMEQMDINHDGEISYGEFMKVFAKGQAVDTVIHKKILGVTAVQAKEMIADKIDGKMTSGFDNHKLREAFQKFDADHSGSISAEEFKNVLVDYTSLEFEEHILNAIIAEVDQDGSGEIDYQEFFHVVGRTGSTGMVTQSDQATKFQAKKVQIAAPERRPATADRRVALSPQPVSRPSTPPQAQPSKPTPQAIKMMKFIADKVCSLF